MTTDTLPSIDTILEQWTKDSQIDKDNLGGEQIRLSSLHAKYISWFFRHRAKLIALQEKMKVVKKNRQMWYMGQFDNEQLSQLGWGLPNIKLTKTEVSSYIEGDEVISKINQAVEYQREIVNTLDQIVKHIQHRGYNIKSAIDWHKFQVGM